MAGTVWDPKQYLRFSDERLRPALDLLARVPLPAPDNVIDLGCGAGNVSVILKQRYPAAPVTGIDGSPTRLDKARATAPECRFVQADIAAWQPSTPPALIYSNAALHWLPDHSSLFPRLLGMVAPGGFLAVQMPAMHDAPFRRLQQEIAAHGPWADLLSGHTSARDILGPEQYWDILKPRAARLDIWETTYLHALQGENAVMEWAAGSSLRPFLDRLPPDLQAGFRQSYADALRPHYPRRKDGTTLLPFRRLFILAQA